MVKNFYAVVAAGKEMMRYGYCGTCTKFTRHTNKRLNCKCEETHEVYHNFQWIDYCKKYNLNPDTGKKKY